MVLGPVSQGAVVAVPEDHGAGEGSAFRDAKARPRDTRSRQGSVRSTQRPSVRPERLRLIDAHIGLSGPGGEVVDEVSSYTAIRSFRMATEHLVLNGRPYPLRLVLDQGYWPDTGMTPPDEGALRRDVELVRAMGFNGVRLRQKVEDPRSCTGPITLACWCGPRCRARIAQPGWSCAWCANGQKSSRATRPTRVSWHGFR
jgi:hypothetical protein